MQDCQDKEKSWEPEDALERAVDRHRSSKLESIKFNYICEMQGTQVTSGLDDPGEDKGGPLTRIWSRKMDDERKVSVLRNACKIYKMKGSRTILGKMVINLAT